MELRLGSHDHAKEYVRGPSYLGIYISGMYEQEQEKLKAAATSPVYHTNNPASHTDKPAPVEYTPWRKPALIDFDRVAPVQHVIRTYKADCRRGARNKNALPYRRPLNEANRRDPRITSNRQAA